MKIWTVLLSVMFSVSLLHAQSAFYVHTSDRQIHPFLFEMVDSMTVSCYDADSLLYEDIVSQWVWTQDSVYCFRLAEIDSISFQTPSTIYAEGVVLIDQQMLPYIMGSDSLKLYFSPQTPNEILPREGTKLLAVETSEQFPMGFMGRVRKIVYDEEKIVVLCDQAFLPDVFERFYAPFKSAEGSGCQSRAKRVGRDNYFDIPIDVGDISIDYHNGVSRPLLLGVELEGGVDLTGNLSFPNTRIAGCLIFEREMGVFLSMTLGSNIKFSGNLSVSGSLSLSQDIITQPVNVVMIIPPVLFMYGKIGMTIGIEGKVSLGSDVSLTVPFATTVNVSNKSKTNIPTTWLPKFGKPTLGVNPLVLSGEVNVHVGAFFEEGLTLISDKMDKAAIRAEKGVSFGLNGQIGANEIAGFQIGTSTYEFVHDNFEWSLTPYTSCSVEASLLGVSGKQTLSLKYDHPWLTAGLVPSFGNIRYDDNLDKGITFTVDVGENVFPAIPVGISIHDDEKKEIFKGFYNESYMNYFLWRGFPSFKVDVPKILLPNKTYRVFPIAKLFGQEDWTMLASPSCEISIDVTPVVDGLEILTSRSAMMKGHVEGKKEYLDKSVTFGFIYGTNSQLESSDTKRVIAQCDPNDNFVATVNDLSGGRTYYYKAFIYGNGEYCYSDETLQFTTPLPVDISSVTTTAAQYRPTDHPQHFIYKDTPFEFKYDVATMVKLTDDKGVENWGYVYEGPYEGDKKSRISLKGAPYEYEDTRFTYYRNGNPSKHTARLYPFVKYTGDDEYYYGEPVDYPLTYPATSTVELTGCSTGDVVTRENVEYNGVTYDYCSTLILDYNATGAYWITVGVEETGNGWNGWDNSLPARERAHAADGSNRLTINYYYNQKELEGDYLLRIKGNDEQHNTSCVSSKSVRLIHDGKAFTGCELVQ